MAMIPSPGLDVDIFVTNFTPTIAKNVPPPSENNGLAAPKPRYADSKALSSDQYDSDDAFVDLSYYTGEFGDEENDISAIPLSERENYTLDLTNFEGDNDESLPGERQLNRKVQKQGKKLREKSRKLSRILDAKQDSDRVVVLDGGIDEDASVRELGHRHERPHSNRSDPDILPYLRDDANDSDDGSIDLGMRPVSLYSPTDYPRLISSPSSSRSNSPPLPFATPSSSTIFLDNRSSSTSHLIPDSSNSRTSSPPRSRPASTSHPLNSLIFPPTHAPVKSSPLSSLPPLNTSTLDLFSSKPTEQNIPQSAISTAMTTAMTEDSHYHDSPSSPHARPRLYIQSQEMRDMSAVSVKVRPGKPKLDRILHEEVEMARGSVVVACKILSYLFSQ